MRAGRVLRQIVITRLGSQIPGVPVVDKPTEKTPMPYIFLGPSYWADASVECIEAREVTLQIDCYDTRTSKGAVEDLVDDISSVLNDWANEAALTMHPMPVTLVRVMDDPDGKSVHGVVQVEAMVENG
ncbi:DUF3168 domain-containing protein [Paracoccus sp. (in: a-proteobacteria)]|uniref:DUF3168 domain-containing protein n=1 Tax=Paracoccus sp. TaxID=267 RepID=UPI0028AA1E16|nr:DUF3168 domain-containing protein [Paracoccus sp. (in: a-proteobacteria)]